MTRPKVPEAATGIDAVALVHALQVHQAELETQNAELAATIDELGRANSALEVAHERYRSLYEVAPAPLITLDLEGSITDVNAAAAALLRATRAELIDRRLAVFVAEAARPAFRACVDDVFARGAVRGIELVLASEHAAPVHVLVDGVTVRDADSQPRRAVLACVDVTAHRRALELQRLESLAVLAGGVAHDFNNLLTVVLAHADHVLHTLDPNAPQASELHEVILAARLAGDLAQQMLAYSGRVSAPQRMIDLGSLIGELEPLLRASANATPLCFELARDLPAIRGDNTQLRQLVLNLVHNAAEATRGRAGAITIAAYAESPSVVLEIRDRGVGMDATTRNRIFEPYFSTKGMGRGLGLAAVEGIVRGHQGAITVESAVDVGTTFRIGLPAVEVGAQAASPPAARPPSATSRSLTRWRGSGRVLVVDDEDRIRRATGRILETLGMTVVLVGDGATAVDHFRDPKTHFDVVFMDLTMPRLDGVETATQIRALRADLPIVLVTGYGKIPAGAGDVFAAVLSKPFGVEAVRDVLQQLLPAADVAGSR